MRELLTLNEIIADSAEAITKRNAKSGGISLVPKYIRKGYGKSLSHLALLLLYALHEVAWIGEIFTTVDFLASNLNVESDKVQQSLQELKRYGIVKVIPGSIKYSNGRTRPDTLCIIITPFESIEDKEYQKAVDEVIVAIQYVIIECDAKGIKHLGKVMTKPLDVVCGTQDKSSVNLIRVGTKYQHPLLKSGCTLIELSYDEEGNFIKNIVEDDSLAPEHFGIENVVDYFYKRSPNINRDLERDIVIVRDMYQDYVDTAEIYGVEYLDLFLYSIDVAKIWYEGNIVSISDIQDFNWVEDVLELTTIRY
ncbi:MAG: hypothetical protein ACYDG2_17185 [Ruminiclostridium sp.]